MSIKYLFFGLVTMVKHGHPISALQTYLEAKGQNKLFQIALKEIEKQRAFEEAECIYEAYREWYVSEYKWMLYHAKMQLLGVD